MKRISKTATIGSIAIASAVFIAGAISTNVKVRDTSDEKIYFESDSKLSTDGSMESLATLSSQDYETYTAQADEYLAAAKVDEEDKDNSDEDAATDDSTEAAESSEEVTEASEDSEDKEEEASEFDTVAISLANPYVNIRSEASEEGEILGKLYKGSIGEISETKGDWVKITSGNVTGYVKAEFVVSGDEAEAIYDQYTTKVATINTETLRVRSEATTESSIITQVGLGEKFDVVDEVDGWVEIDVKGENGYVSADYLTFDYDYVTAISIEEEKAAAEAAKKAEEEALKKEQEEKAAAEAAKKAEEEKAKKAAEEKAAAEKAAASTSSSSTSSSSTSSSSTQTPETVTGSATSYSEDDLKLLACLVYTEAGGEPYESQLAVANVVLNRVKSSSYPNTISGVIYQASQFGPASNGSLARRLNNYTASGSSYRAAKAALEGSNNIGTRKNFNSVSATSSHSNDIIMGVIRFY